jgi:predicted nucleotidyltransferase
VRRKGLVEKLLETAIPVIRSAAANEPSNGAIKISEMPAYRPNVPTEASNAMPLLKHRLGTSLSAVYLHGSAVAEGLRKMSDVDLIAVVDEALPASIRANLSSDLLTVSGHYPVDSLERRPLEVIIFRRGDLEDMPYPARAEFVYGEWLRAAVEGGTFPEATASPEFTLLLAQAREEAVPLLGPDITDLVAAIPFAVIRSAINDLLPELIETVEGDERNVILTLARMWRTAATGQFVSKNGAADWAAPRLSVRAAETLDLARDAYVGHSEDELRWRRTDVSQTIDEMRHGIVSALRSFE